MRRPQITPEEVRRIATLSMLRVEDDEIPPLVEHFTRVLDFVELLSEVEVGDGLDRLAPIEAEDLRSDELRGPQEAGGPVLRPIVLEGAPQSDDESFLVPRVVERESSS